MSEAVITIRSIHTLEGKPEPGPELVTLGDYLFGADGIRITYLESELTGLGSTKTAFLVRPEEVVLTRRGDVNTRMVFHPGEQQTFRYQTAMGTLNMGLNTHRLDWKLDEHGGDMEIEYDLRFDRSFLSRNQFIINVKEKDECHEPD